MTTSGVPGCRSRSLCASSAPLMTGIRMSEMTRSYRVASSRSSASAPSRATSTSAPVSARISARFSANETLSSTTRYLRTVLPHGQRDHEPRASSRARLVVDRSAMVLDDASDEGQTEPDALGLGRDERLEQALADGRIHARPAVVDYNRDPPIIGGGRDPNLALGTGGMHGVVEEID